MFVISCQTNRKFRRQTRELERTIEVYAKGFVGSTFVFSDTRNRNLRIVFLNDSIFELSNTSSVPTVFHSNFLNFKCKFLYEKINIHKVYVVKDIDCKIPKLPSLQYLKPFDFSHFTIDEHAIEYLFPNIDNDTVRFSADLQKLQIREFCFERK